MENTAREKIAPFSIPRSRADGCSASLGSPLDGGQQLLPHKSDGVLRARPYANVGKSLLELLGRSKAACDKLESAYADVYRVLGLGETNAVSQ